MAPRALYRKLWDSHVVHTEPDGTSLLYIDRHFLHEVCTPQAFEGIANAGRLPWRTGANLAMADHNVPTTDRSLGISNPASRMQVDVLTANCEKYGIASFGMNDPRQGIVHVVGPELGASLPGMSIVCGDSHTSTHGALGALAIGLGTSDVELVLSSQCLITKPLKTMLVRIEGQLSSGISAKDLALAVIRRLGIGGGREHAIEFAGEAIRSLSMEGRMTLCNMAIEAGARAGIVAVDSTTLQYLEGRPYAPKGALWERAVEAWQELKSDDGAVFDTVVHIEGSSVAPTVTWGTVPDMSVDIDGVLPDPAKEPDPQRRSLFERAYQYMGLVPGLRITDVSIDKVFIGSCTNGRIEDLRAAAAVLKGRRVASTIKRAMVVPGSTSVRRQAETEGLDRIFREAGFEWREAGCSMCLGMNDDVLGAGERCASTSNRNFEGRQGEGGRTHLVSPAMAAAAAVMGRFVDVREWETNL